MIRSSWNIKKVKGKTHPLQNENYFQTDQSQWFQPRLKEGLIDCLQKQYFGIIYRTGKNSTRRAHFQKCLTMALQKFSTNTFWRHEFFKKLFQKGCIIANFIFGNKNQKLNDFSLPFFVPCWAVPWAFEKFKNVGDKNTIEFIFSNGEGLSTTKDTFQIIFGHYQRK